MNFLESLKAVWQRITLVQQALLIGMVVACLITGFVLTKWATKPRMAVLFSGVAAGEAAKIIDKVQERGIEYKLSAGGSSIYVDSTKVHELRLLMAKEGLPSSSQKGWSLFENSKIGESPLAQDVKHLQALQEELAMTIQMIDSVSHARVHLVLPEKTLFAAGGNDAKASVTISMFGGRLPSPANIAAITHIVAGSVEGLTPANVKVTDNTGRLLSGLDDGRGVGAGTYLDYKEKVQKSLEKKVGDMLERVLGPGRSTITVCAEIDMTSIEVQETTIEGKGIPIEERNSSNKKVQGSANSEEAGSRNEEKDEESEIKYLVPQKITKTSEVPGRIVSLSVSAMVDLAMPVDQDEETTEAAPKMLMSIEQVKQIIRNAVGRDILLDEALTVVNVPFNRPEPVYNETRSMFGVGQIMEYIKQGSLGIMALCALLVFKVFAGGKDKKGTTTSDLAELSAPAQAAALPAPSDQNALRRQITGAIKNNPEQVRQLFSSWIQEG